VKSCLATDETPIEHGFSSHYAWLESVITNVIQFLHTTAAYQTAALQVMVGEANFAAKQLDLKETVPLQAFVDTNQWTVMPPPMGVGGSVLSSNYVFIFSKGRLNSIHKMDWFKKLSPPITNLLELANQPSLIGADGAYQLATQWLARLSVDPELERKLQPQVFQVPATRISTDGHNLPGLSNNVAIPLFQVSWGEGKPPRDFMNPVRMQILGTTKELLELVVRDASFFKRLPLTVSNVAELLGPLPPPRHFVEQLVGGEDAYQTISHPGRVEGWLLRSQQEDGDFTKNTARAGPLKLKPEIAKLFSDTLLDFNSYAWTVQKLCSPDYGLRLQFARGNDVVEFLLCYECDILEVTYKGRTTSENFDYGHNKLVRALQAVFPEDEIVKKLELNNEKAEDLLKMFQSQ
jgi:hypothetical protein